MVKQRSGEIIADEPLLAFHDDAGGRVVVSAHIGGPHGGDRAWLHFHGAVELEDCLLVASLAKDLEATQA